MNDCINTATRKQKNRLLRLCRLALLLLLLLCAGPVQAQLINGDFETLGSGCTAPQNQAFQGTTPCVTGSWFVSHGTPDIDINKGGNSTNFAYLWTNGGTVADGEGLFIHCPTFTQGVTYRVSLSLYSPNTPPSRFVIALSNNLNHNTSTSLLFPQNTFQAIVHQITTLSTGSWQTFTFSFTPSANYQQLWFYPRDVHGFCEVYMDNVTVSISCPANRSYSNFSGTPAQTSVINSIQASGTSAVTGGQQITYKAGNYVRLQPNFQALPSGTGFFHAYIAPCENTPIQACNDNIAGPIPKLGADMTSGSDTPPASTELTTATGLIDNYPNPFTGITTVGYVVEQQGHVSLTVTTMLGEQIAELVQNSSHAPGRYSIEFNGSGLAPGVYYLRLMQGTTSIVRKMVISP